MAADFTLKASQQSTQDLLQYEGEENLLDEEPNIVDGSFIAADEPVEKSAITLKEFLKATGLHFIDGLTTTLRRDTTAFSRSNEPTRLDVIAAANLYMPELSIYEEACKSLSKRIEEDRHSLRELEAEVTENTPPVFYDFFEASESEQENMRQRVKSAKLIARCASKKMWYGFREIIFRPLKEGIALKIQHLRQDIERVGEYSESLEKLILDGQPQLSDLSAKVERMKERHDALSSSDPKMMMLLKRKVDEQRLMIEEIPRTILEHQETVKSLNEEIEQETAKKGTLLEEYDRLERQLEDLRRQQQGDKRGIVETYRLLALTHGWEPYRSRELTAEVGLKWRDRATLESKNGEVLASINMELVLVNEMREEIRKTTSIQRTYSTIEEMPRAMDETSFQLCRMRGLLHDVNQARKVYPIQTSLVEGSDGSKAVVARVSVFDHLTSTKAELLIHFDISRPIAYPSGRFVCSVDIWRGNARSEGEFIEALNLAPRRWGRLARALRDVKSLFLQ
ncbi:Spc7 kinetochore protein-domain-containing protein [Zopfochytrium polystomum]|nr:Spc7 kinetochore protein-domain-containing protein [Zopfochytrium polystomum]